MAGSPPNFRAEGYEVLKRSNGVTQVIKNIIMQAALLLLVSYIGGAQPADTILLGGKIPVLDAVGRTVQALAIRGGRIAAVGSDAQIRAYAGKTTKVIPLNGRMVVPG
jgi:adenine deaminase